MTEHPPCADRCTLVADLAARIARAEGRTERDVRVSIGLSPEHIPPVPRLTTSAAARWLTDAEFTD